MRFTVGEIMGTGHDQLKSFGEAQCGHGWKYASLSCGAVISGERGRGVGT